MVLDLVNGATGPIHDAVVLNAGVALAVADASASSVTDQESFDAAMQRGVDKAIEALASGAAKNKLVEWKAATLA